MDLPKRKQIRLREYNDSTPGAYFVTICTNDRRCILSDIVVGDGVLDVPNVRLSPYGKIVAETLREIEKTYTWLALDRYVIMPNHIHILLRMEDRGPGNGLGTAPARETGDGPSRTPAPTNSRLAALISTMKRFTNKRCGAALWQRSYHEHVIRNENDYRQIWEYIDSNPVKWAEDRYYQVNDEQGTEARIL